MVLSNTVQQYKFQIPLCYHTAFGLLFSVILVSIVDVLFFFFIFFLSLDFRCVGRTHRKKTWKAAIRPLHSWHDWRKSYGVVAQLKVHVYDIFTSFGKRCTETDTQRMSVSVINCCNSFAHSSTHQTVKHWTQNEIGKTTWAAKNNNIPTRAQTEREQ